MSLDDLVDYAQIAAAVLAGAALLFAAWQVWLTIGNERKRIQPILIAHEGKSRHQRGGVTPGWAVWAYLTNEGQGAAFNVRFGIEFDGVRWPYRLETHDLESGNRQRVVGPGSRLPQTIGNFYEIALPDLGLLGVAQVGWDDRRVYWCRYENAIGQTWETRNPADRSADLSIYRVRRLRWREWREGRARKKADERGAEREQKIVEELSAASGAAADGGPQGTGDTGAAATDRPPES